jgi:adenosine deaminase CECR1
MRSSKIKEYSRTLTKPKGKLGYRVGKKNAICFGLTILILFCLLWSGCIQQKSVELPYESLLTTTDPSEFKQVYEQFKADQKDAYTYFQGNTTPEEDLLNLKLQALVHDYKQQFKEGYANIIIEDYESLIEAKMSSPLGQFLKEMPKGAMLHCHFSGSVHLDQLVDILIEDYAKECKVYYPYYPSWFAENSFPKYTLSFFGEGPGWITLEAYLRPNPTKRREELIEGLGFHVEDRSTTWDRFGSCFAKLYGVIDYGPLLQVWITAIMSTMEEQGVYYCELKDDFGGLKDPYDNEIGIATALKLAHQAVEEFQQTNPNCDLRFVLTSSRSLSESDFGEYLKQAVELNSKHPDYVLGIDLCGEEDPNHRAMFYRDQFLWLRDQVQNHGCTLKISIHAGESLDSTNSNVIDSFFLGADRIGHGINLIMDPYSRDIIKEYQKAGHELCIELNPVSNKLLGYVEDFRIHPAQDYIREGFPVTLSSDDEGLFYTNPTPDYIEAVVNWNLDWYQIKQICKNSIQHSFLPEADKQRLMNYWEEQLAVFIQEQLDRDEKQTQEDKVSIQNLEICFSQENKTEDNAFVLR